MIRLLEDMNNKDKVLFLLLVSVLSISIAPASSFGQLNSTAPWSSSTGYGEDTILVFYSGQSGRELSFAPDQGGTYDFLWRRFNKSTLEFDSLLVHAGQTETALGLDSLYDRGLLEDAVEGLGLQVKENQTVIDSLRAWVVTDTMQKVNIVPYINNCNQIKVWVRDLRLIDYTYYDLSLLPDDPQPLDLDNELARFEWTASASVEIYWEDTPLYEGDRVVGYLGSPYEMPYEDSDYFLEVANRFDNTVRDTIEDVTARATKAEFAVDKITPEGALVDYSPDEINEAPLQVLLENRSKNASKHHWKGFNDSLNILRGRDSLLWSSRQEEPAEAEIPPYDPGRYPVKLKVTNEHGCVDSTTYYHVRVDSSRLDSSLIPNVFTPDGNGLNDVFVLPKATNLTGSGKRGIVSMKWIEVTIFNRSGQLVYRYNGDPMQWEGWRGKVRNSNRDAAEGVYLYVIKGRGYDWVMHENKQYSGFLYLFRE